MSLIVEDGTVIEGADSYLSVAEADSIIAYLGLSDTWKDLDEETKEISLRQASMAFDGLGAWKSFLVDSNQPMLFPREPFYDSQGRLVTGIPRPLKYSVAKLAVAASEGGGKINTDPIRLKSKSFGDASETYATPVLIGDTQYNDVRVDMQRLGYLRSGMSWIEIQRA